MLKKSNIIILFLLIPFSLELNIGFSFILPIFLFYILKDSKNIYFSLIPSLFITIFFEQTFFVQLVLCYIFTIIFYLILVKLKSVSNLFITCITGGYILIYNTINNFIINQYSIFSGTLSLVLSVVIYIFLERTLINILTKKNDQSHNIYMAYLDIFLLLIVSVSSATKTILHINIGFIMAIYGAMYIGRINKNIFSLIYGVSAMFCLYFIYDIKISFIIPLVSSIYIMQEILVIFLFNLINFFLIVTNIIDETPTILAMMVLSIIFELCNSIILDGEKNEKEMYIFAYEQIQKNTTNEILNFSHFLDKFVIAFKNPKDFNENISNGIKIIVQNACSTCSKRKECFSKYKAELYNIFKNLIIKQENTDEEFLYYCVNIKKLDEVVKKITIDNLNTSQNNIMLAQLTSLSNAIKKYSIEMNSQQEIPYYSFLLFKRKLKTYGYTITYFEVFNYTTEKFKILVGISNESFLSIKSTIELIANATLNLRVSVELDHINEKIIYICVIPRLEIEITYGFGSLSCDGEEICGDNYLIKSSNDGSFVCAISDGMGKGYRAFYESNMTLKLIEEITSLNISPNTALEILNSFYSVQEYLEEYATLDFLEIDKHKKMANFYKMGAATTYILKGSGEIMKITNKSLPFGLEEEIAKTEYELNLGDVIFMTSDGIFENIVDEDKMNQFLISLKSQPPQTIVYEIINYTINNKIKTKDDMSVIVLKVDDVA